MYFICEYALKNKIELKNKSDFISFFYKNYTITNIRSILPHQNSPFLRVIIIEAIG